VLGILPFFHSYGLTVTLWLPLVKALGVSYYPTPLDARGIGETVQRHRVTHLFATPSFLSIYARRTQPGQFGSLTYAQTGAEKLRPAVAEAFEARFGLKPIEGYGATECSPVVTMNTCDYRCPGIYQAGARAGSVGHPLPGVALRVVDIETGETLPPGRPGMLLARGPNVMSGYFDAPELTAEVLRDGWYVTGDVAMMDDDGFVRITDRLSRFSKIAGEMVPHVKIEEALQELSGEPDRAFAVTGVADPKKGERLVALHTLPEAKAREVAAALQQSGLPALWIPNGATSCAWTKFPTRRGETGLAGRASACGAAAGRGGGAGRLTGRLDPIPREAVRKQRSTGARPGFFRHRGNFPCRSSSSRFRGPRTEALAAASGPPDSRTRGIVRPDCARRGGFARARHAGSGRRWPDRLVRSRQRQRHVRQRPSRAVSDPARWRPPAVRRGQRAVSRTRRGRSA
jgi:hypothetical protein